jgi:hypothetical protein|tara:strand:- start:12248 stop:12841 length:594 start_codon:yes stop_codon:yes gene_type:complete
LASLLYRLEQEAFRAGIQARTDDAREWFRVKVKQLGKINRQQLLKDEALIRKSRTMMGHMYMYFYDPKHRETLPYYDAFPLTIMVERAPGGFYGLNLHYLKPKTRALFLDKLTDTLTNDKYDESTRFRARYNLLSSVRKYKEFEPCFKHYLSSQIDSKIVLVQPPEWEIAIFLPTEQFMKARKTEVWQKSAKTIRGA